MLCCNLHEIVVLFAIGPALGPVWSGVVAVGIVALSVLATWISLWPHRKFQRELAERESLDDTEFFKQFYANTDISAHLVRRLRSIYCKQLGIEVGKLRPLDHHPMLAELDSTELMEEIESEFGVSISDKDAEAMDGSFDSIVRFLATRSRQPV